MNAINLLASILPLACFLAYPLVIEQVEKFRPSLSLLMNIQRRRWVANAIKRESPMDAILSGNLMSSVSFFASTTALLILAVFAVFGQLASVVEATGQIQPHLSEFDVELELISILAMLVLGFLSFTMSLRQFNHFCIMLGAVNHDGTTTPDEITTIAALNSLAARSFNHGLRSYYFSLAGLVWFVSTGLSVVATLIIIGVLVWREFFSLPRALVDTLKDK